MARGDLVQELLDLPDEHARQRALLEREPLLDDAVFEALKAEADQLLRSDLEACARWCDLMTYGAGLTGAHHHRAQALLARANYHLIGTGDCASALALYETAADLYAEAGDEVWQARSQIGKVATLARLGRYDEAVAASLRAEPVLDTPDLWLHHANLLLNQGYIYGRLGEEQPSLDCYVRARELHAAYGGPESPSLAWIDQSTSIALRNLGRLDEAAVICQRAEAMLERLGQTSEAARSRQARGVIEFLSGRYNRALQLISEARQAFADDNRHRDALLADLLICDCLLQLGRYRQVLARSERIPDHFADYESPGEQAQALLYRAVAYAGLRRYADAQNTLDQAQDLFDREGSAVWLAHVDLERAAIYHLQNDHTNVLRSVMSAQRVYDEQGLVNKSAQALLYGARAAFALSASESARTHAQAVLDEALERDLPALSHQAYHLLGRIAAAEGDSSQALVLLDRALDQLERLRGRIMVEYRASFIENKDVIYQDAIALALEREDPALAMTYVERGKSRALVELLAHRLDMSVRPRSERDAPLAAELDELRTRREVLYRDFEGRNELLNQGWMVDDDARQRSAQEALDLERRITTLWHEMLVRNADYARDAELERVPAPAPPDDLPPGVLLAEYAEVQGRLVVLTVTEQETRAVPLEVSTAQVGRLQRLLRLNLSAAASAEPDHRVELEINARKVLARLYTALVAPWREHLEGLDGLIVVPAGPLHHLPFAALFDGERYLAERLAVSVLPSASVLPYCQAPRRETSGSLVVGHTYGGAIPLAEQEARAVAALVGGELLVDRAATRQAVMTRLPASKLVHLAAHGAFREGNPLFAGVALDDGWLTMLDVFGLDLAASLVTLSACESARVEVQGGDELYGLMRAFLHAGAASLLISLWTVDDRSTSALMARFYRALMAGVTKAEALRDAQCAMLRGEMGAAYRHPYYWAAFSLVGAREGV